ncbi:uncharacterized protein [Cicer arietinum]|uniref:Biogenesis of lysosome-related organelles complex 1 subunit 7 n=1 Tax=Cicer arietinum TaxID=3827 RepID=A0A1S2XG49_CICAR|nr:uncharacterized protein LOC101502919 [Cicer arietinum]XP_012567926.1 uncharacterized protein LOC101502919 [Cicer arietinum]
METSTNTHYTSPDENDTVFVQTEPSSSRAGDNSSETDNSGDSLTKSSDLLAKGLSSILSTVIRDFDFRAQQTLMSQNHLSSSIDRLTGELDQLLEDAPLPFIMQHAAKISSVRKRVLSLNSLLKSIQGRIDNIDRIMSIGTTHEKAATEGSG